MFSFLSTKVGLIASSFLAGVIVTVAGASLKLWLTKGTHEKLNAAYRKDGREGLVAALISTKTCPAVEARIWADNLIDLFEQTPTGITPPQHVGA